MSPHSLTKLEIQKYQQNKPIFHDGYSRIKSPKTNDEVYVINLDKYKSVGTHWIAILV